MCGRGITPAFCTSTSLRHRKGKLHKENTDSLENPETRIQESLELQNQRHGNSGGIIDQEQVPGKWGVSLACDVRGFRLPPHWSWPLDPWDALTTPAPWHYLTSFEIGSEPRAWTSIHPPHISISDSAGSSNFNMAAATPEIPSTMRSWAVTKNGPPETSLALDTSVPVPTPRGSHILVKVSHAALNPVDIHHMKKIPTILPFRRRPTPALDFCGTVVALGPSVQASGPLSLDVGAVVCGAIPASKIATGTGALAEYIAVPADVVAPKPDALSEAASAGLGIAGQTAAMVMREAKVEKGTRVMINGASGGVGTMLCQMATGRGGVVTAVCSDANSGLVKRLGATEVSGPR